MDLDHYHYHDGRPVSFDRQKVVHIEPHESGSGTLIRLDFGDHSAAVHLREDYEYLIDRITDGTTTRLMRSMAEDASEVFDKKAYLASAVSFGQ